jgi:LysM repeat protein
MLGFTRIAVCGLLAGASAAVSIPALTASAAAAPAGQSYTVVRGDNLSRIASRNHTTVTRLVELNKSRYPSLARNPRLIHPGWVLTVGGAQATSPAPRAPVAAQPSAPVARTYTVVRGDTLSRIASRKHTTVARLVELNKGRYPSLAKNSRLIFAGWVLKIG